MGGNARPATGGIVSKSDRSLSLGHVIFKMCFRPALNLKRSSSCRAGFDGGMETGVVLLVLDWQDLR